MTGQQPFTRSERRAVIVIAALSALSAIGGGIALVVAPGDSVVVPELSTLAHTPFSSFLAPGLLLVFVVGGTSVASAILAWRCSRAAIDATLLAGGALTVFVVAEVAMMREVHVLHVVYGGLGVALLALGVRAGWRSRVPRQRWVIGVTAAEALGYLAPAITGIVVARTQLAPAVQVAALACAGLVEGFVLGSGQAHVLPIRVARLRFALLTALGAGVVWFSVMAMMIGIAPPAIVPVVAIVGLVAIGGAQWLELRRYREGAWRWIGWTALAWTLALPLSFTPGPFVDDATPQVSNVTLWALGGVLMAYAMALVTWGGARWLAKPSQRVAQRPTAWHPAQVASTSP